jgi:hypothetical protein
VVFTSAYCRAKHSRVFTIKASKNVCHRDVKWKKSLRGSLETKCKDFLRYIFIFYHLILKFFFFWFKQDKERLEMIGKKKKFQENVKSIEINPEVVQDIE